jgi:hypothetical protein
MKELLEIYIIKNANRSIISVHLSEDAAKKAKQELDKICCDKCPFYYIESYKIEND